MTNRIDWEVEEGFLNGAKYRMHYHLIFRDFEHLFEGADQIKVLIKEKPYSMLSLPGDLPIKFSDDGKMVSINFTDSRYYDRSGRPTSLPEPIEVFRDLRFLMEKAAEEYKIKFSLKPEDTENGQPID